jgi:hypothetical protein
LSKIPSAQAGYMELHGARKDADCRKVEVAGGVSKRLGCCDEFHPESDKTQHFCCGDCEYVQRRGLGAQIGRK